jgi:flagellar hook-associated protein 2
MPTINFGGLASGLDSNSIISALVGAERTPIRQMQQQQADIRSQLSILASIQSKMSALQTKAQALDTMGEFQALKASSSDAERVSVASTTGASAGSYSIDDVVLAKAQKNRSNTFAARTSTIGTGTFRITQGGTNYDITVDGTNNTLEGLVAEINAKSGLDVSASLFYDGSQYRVLLTSDQTGTDAAFTVDESSLTGGPLLGFGDVGNTITGASNASFELDGQAVTSQSNTVTGVLDGLTITLKEEFTSSPITVSIDTDADAVVANVKAFVDAYNAASGAISAQFKYSGTGSAPKISSTLFGDSTLRSAQLAMTSTVAARVTGLPDSMSALSDAGVTIDRYGTMVLDETKLRTALTDDRLGVARVFATDGATIGIASQLATAMTTYVDSTNGLLEAKETALNGRITDLDSRIASAEQRVVKFEESLRAQFTALERVMSQLQTQGNFITQQLTRSAT